MAHIIKYEQLDGWNVYVNAYPELRVLEGKEAVFSGWLNGDRIAYFQTIVGAYYDYDELYVHVSDGSMTYRDMAISDLLRGFFVDDEGE